jgi:adenylyltransferase/sulfurtransferase
MAIPPLLQRRLPQITSENQQQLTEARVLVVGTGALALAALRYLAAAGIGAIGLLDTAAAPAEGEPVDEELLATLAGINPSTTVTIHAERLARRADTDAASAILAGYHLVLDASDPVPVRFLIADTCLALGLPLIWASVARVNGQLTVFPAAGNTNGPGFRDLFPAPELLGEPQYAPEYLLGALRGQLGSLMAVEAVKVLAGVGEPVSGQVLQIDADSGQFSEISFRTAATDSANSPAISSTTDSQSA